MNYNSGKALKLLLVVFIFLFSIDVLNVNSYSGPKESNEQRVQ
jgi:hypothetical protein